MSGEAGFPWNELGLPPAATQQAIRAAYAARLKQIDMRADPEAFRRLRAAFEHAMGLRPPQDAGPPPKSPPRPPDTACAEIIALVVAGDAQAAVRRLDASDTVAFSLDDLGQVEAALLPAAADLPRPAMLALVRRFDWDHAAHWLRARHREAFHRLDQRLLLEHRREELERLRRRSPAARILLKGPPGRRSYLFTCWYVMLGPERRKLAGWLDQIERTPHAGEVFDTARLRWCRRWLQPWRRYTFAALAISSISPITAISTGEFRVALLGWAITLVPLFFAWGLAMLTAYGAQWGRTVMQRLARAGRGPGLR